MTSTTTSSISAVERYVPQGPASLADDAPGWKQKDNDDENGPTCWKCKGVGKVRGSRKRKKKTKKKKDAPAAKEDYNINNNKTTTEEPPPRSCPVCEGRGYLLKRKIPPKPGVITRGRQGWTPCEPLPDGMKHSSEDDWAAKLVWKANKERVDVEIIPETRNNVSPPVWLPGVGEELCNLVGSWRILQRVGSHRWTTDDLVTARVAADQLTQSTDSIHYLDLGTGNASVLQMVTWNLLNKKKRLMKAIGIEARSEAVALARRSLAFNLGSSDTSVASIHHGDFRDVVLEGKQFDLITGTPPYFRVDFHTTDAGNNNQKLVSKAVINQGGMPTSKQSAPARCEFRGGIEAYCQAASPKLKAKTGRFVVCENWLNHDRVVQGAEDSGLHILRIVEVRGREQKETLFAVYVMVKKGDGQIEDECVTEILTVRDMNGDWTDEYKSKVLDAMSIPF